MIVNRVLVFCLTAGVALAQSPSEKLVNNGKALHLPFRCTPDDTQNFGLTCPPQHACPVYLELSGVDTSLGRLFLAGNFHTENNTLYSVLLATDDGGATWTEPHERIRGAALDQIQFFDLETGWVSGQQAGPVPRDPFLLLTRDGGKNWRAQQIYTETRVGTIEAFRFDTKAHGLLWMDRSQAGEPENRYELLETTTGGDNWTLREGGSKPAAAKPGPAAGASGYRLRTDAVTKSYRLERQSGGRWVPLASFLVRVGECREVEGQLAPAPLPDGPAQP